MKELISISLPVEKFQKTISVYWSDITEFQKEIDILTTSAFYRSYAPTSGTLFEALNYKGISVHTLAKRPEIDLRDFCHVWLSKKIENSKLQIGRIGCIEMTGYTINRDMNQSVEKEMLAAMRAYFQMLDIAATFGVKMDTIALPLLGAGSQRISHDLVLVPMIKECVELLKRNEAIKHIYFIECNCERAESIQKALEESLMIKEEQQKYQEEQVRIKTNNIKVFISYSSIDVKIAENLCEKLETRGIKVWYAPRNIGIGDYAGAIVSAIRKSTHFVVILSKNSLQSQHVLNEVDLAFAQLNRKMKIKPLRIDEEELGDSFAYYLSRQHHKDAVSPPLELRLNEFADEILLDINE